MHLATAKIQDFRNLGELIVHLKAGLNVLLGRNNVGKTNLFQAIRHCLGPTASLGENLWLTEDDFARADDGSCSFKPIRVALVFEDLNPEQEAQFFEILEVDLQLKAPPRAIINFEATWDPQRRRVRTERWGGVSDTDRPTIPQEILSALPVTYLPALRDAEQALQPGRRSRLALLVRDLIERSDAEKRTEFGAKIESIFADSNSRLLDVPVIAETAQKLSDTTKELAGPDHVPSSLQASEPIVLRVLQTLRLVLTDGPIAEIHLSGLGYNNLLFISMVMSHLAAAKHETPILLVEEPEAHLHPQLVQLLGDYLAQNTEVPQAIVSSHSAPLAASVRPSQIVLLHKAQHALRVSSMHRLGLSAPEERQLQRMMDITRAALYFANGAILVEGISEEILMPALAKLVGRKLRDACVSVIPICGVSFGTFKKLLGEAGLTIPVSIVTDSDPPITRGKSWKSDVPEIEPAGGYRICDRTKKLMEEFSDCPTVKVFRSHVTLEFDLAAAGASNPALMAEVWEECFTGRPGTLNIDKVSLADDKSLAVWRGICRASHTGSKAEFAHLLAQRVEDTQDVFVVPEYLREAIKHACGGAGVEDSDQ